MAKNQSGYETDDAGTKEIRKWRKWKAEADKKAIQKIFSEKGTVFAFTALETIVAQMSDTEAAMLTNMIHQHHRDTNAEREAAKKKERHVSQS